MKNMFDCFILFEIIWRHPWGTSEFYTIIIRVPIRIINLLMIFFHVCLCIQILDIIDYLPSLCKKQYYYNNKLYGIFYWNYEKCLFIFH